MDRVFRIARIIGIWVFGLIAGGAAGNVLGAGFKYGYDNFSQAGTVAGMCLCVFSALDGRKNRQKFKLRHYS